MRRGLISWSRAELPEAVLDTRVGAVQAAMAADGCDALATYTSPARTAGASWLAGFVPYWNEGLLVVPREGRPVMISALSNRVRDWIERNAHVTEVRNAPLIGVEAAKLVSSWSPRAKIALVDKPQIPAAVVQGMTAAGHVVVDGSAILAGLRATADPAEIALTARAAAIARQALDAGQDILPTAAGDATALVARIDGEARRLGAEEVYLAVAVDLDQSTRLVRLEGSARLAATAAVRVSVAYKGAWVRITRTLVHDPVAAPGIEAAAGLFADAVARLPDTAALQHARSWLIEATRTTLPLEPLQGSVIDFPIAVAAGGLVNVQATFEVAGRPMLIAGPALIGHARGVASCLLSAAS